MTRIPTSPSASSPPQFAPIGIVPTAEQREIQTCRARYVIAMANAGAAKTTTLALRIAESITRGVWPESILALTFSEEAARVLQARLVGIGVDERTARRVKCLSFDAFARQVLLNAEGAEAPWLNTPEALAPQVRAAALQLQTQNAARRHPRELWLPEHNEPIFEFLELSRRLKARLVPPGGDEDEEESVEECAERFDVPLAAFLLHGALEALRSGLEDVPRWRAEFDATYDLARRLSDVDRPIELPAYRIVVVDELQDMNPASYAVLEALLMRGKAFFTGAGDFDQVIHRWAGAGTDFLHTSFGRGWPGVVRLPLTRSYRYGPPLAAATAALKDKAVDSGREHETVLRVQPCADVQATAAQVAADLAGWKQRGGRPAGCAVILRAPYQSIPIENALLEAGIGWRMEGLTSYLLRSEVLMLRGVIAFALQDYDSIPGVDKRLQVLQALLQWQQFEWGAERRDDEALKTAAAQPSLFEAFLDGTLLKPQTRADKRAAGQSGEAQLQEEFRFLDKLKALRHSGQHHEANALQRVREAEATTVDESPAQRNARERLGHTLATLRAAPPDTPAATLLEQAVALLDLKGVARRLFLAPATAALVARSIDGFIDVARRQNLPLRDFAHWLRKAESKAERLRKSDTVLLCSVEAAKGQEFEAVLLPFLEEGAFPLAGCDAGEESNRFYVAATRARDELHLYVPEATERVSRYVKAMRIDKAVLRGRHQLASGQWN